jgi:hypothetical protein
MCVNYAPPKREVFDLFELPVPKEMAWQAETYQDYDAPIIRRSQEGSKEVILASYGMVPKRHIPPTVKKYTTMNARGDFRERTKFF